MAQSLAIIVPILNEAKRAQALKQRLAAYPADEIIVVDGGSEDQSAQILQGDGIQVLVSPKGRAKQQQHGAKASTSDWLLFLHADTALPTNFRQELDKAWHKQCGWGRFDVRFTKTNSSLDRAMTIVALFMSWRSRLTAIATGDQALFVRRDLFDQIGGFTDQPLMEDIDLSKRLKREARCYASRVGQ